jgi:DNA-binding response OmpR family regulator
MSKILVVEPEKMLQHAIVVALFPEHHVHLSEKIPEAEPLAEADLAIIDAGALRERDLLTAGAVRAVQKWRVPVVLIDAEALGDVGASKNFGRLITPLKRDELRAAVAHGLRSLAAADATLAPAVKGGTSPVATKKKTSELQPDSVAYGNGKEVIELVDVIEETPGHDEARNKD